MNKTSLDKKIEQIINDLKKYNPEKIILFGSAAQGKLLLNSDIDLLIIKETREHFLERLKRVALMCSYEGAIDLLVYTPKELKERDRLGDHFIKEILSKGKVVYEKPQVRKVS